MKNSPLAALYVTFILAMSVAAWADGCLTATPAVPIPAAQNMKKQDTPPLTTYQSECWDQFCNGPYNVYQQCPNSDCKDGYCSEPASASYCTGANSPWTEQFNSTIVKNMGCYTEPEQAGSCWPRGLLVNENVPYCHYDGTGPGTYPCYTTWYNNTGCSDN